MQARVVDKIDFHFKSIHQNSSLSVLEWMKNAYNNIILHTY